MAGPTPWIVALCAAWVCVAFHCGWSMRRSGRRWWVWFALSLLFVPVVVVSFVDYFRRPREHRPDGGRVSPPARCTHCGAVLGPDRAGTRRVGGSTICADCGMVLDDEGLT